MHEDSGPMPDKKAAIGASCRHDGRILGTNFN